MARNAVTTFNIDLGKTGEPERIGAEIFFLDLHRGLYRLVAWGAAEAQRETA